MDLQKRMGGGIKSPLVSSDTSSLPSKTDRKNITIDISRLSPDDTLTLKLSDGSCICLSSSKIVQNHSPAVVPQVEQPQSPVVVEPIVQDPLSPAVVPQVEQPQSPVVVEPIVQDHSPAVVPQVEQPESPVVGEPKVQQYPYQEPPRAIVRRAREPEWSPCYCEEYDGNTCRININTYEMRCYRSDKKTVIPISAHRYEYADGSVEYFCYHHHQLYYKNIVR